MSYPHRTSLLRRACLTGAVALVAGAAAVTLGASSGAAADGGVVYVVQGLPGRTVDVAIDGETVASGVKGATLTDALRIDSGSHTITFTSEGKRLLERSLTIKSGGSTDVVLHLPVDPAGAPVVTLFDNTSTPVTADKASVTVAHTAAVPPADIRVNGKVFFANVANGESLNLVVPADTYAVDIVPAGASSPVVLGPLDLEVKGGSLNRVFAVGDPTSSSMRAVVQVLPLTATGSPAPDLVDTGTGGQAAGDPADALLRVPLRR
ncbi:DUF4397 domain-containing protein [Humibacillus xanthopallidus]|uniref:DUF4397 domain-containing protein n=1 Tax=Humibacillus xanthopallidus TaxID=412689 RepID=UPI00384FB1CC